MTEQELKEREAHMQTMQSMHDGVLALSGACEDFLRRIAPLGAKVQDVTEDVSKRLEKLLSVVTHTTKSVSEFPDFPLYR